MIRALPKSALISVCVLAGVLAVVAFLVRPRPIEVTGPVVLVPLAPSEIRTLKSSGPSGEASVVYEPALGRWIVNTDQEDLDAPQIAWPAFDGRARGGLRVLARLQGTPTESEQDQGTGPAWTHSLTLEAADGRAWTLRFGPAVVGGTGLVQITAPDGSVTHALVDASVVEIGTAGLATWREDAAMPLNGAVPRTIEAAAPTGSVAFDRGARGWSVRMPSGPLRAEPEAVAQFVGRLGALRGQLVPDPSLTSSATAIVACSVPRSDGGSTIWQLEIHGASGLDASRVRVVSSGAIVNAAGEAMQLLGPLHATVDRELLAAIPIAAEPYLAATSAAVGSQDVRVLYVQQAQATAPVLPNPSVSIDSSALRINRTPSGWSLETGSDALLDRLVLLLTEARSQRAMLTVPDTFTPLATVQLAPTDGIPSAAATVGFETDASGAATAWGVLSGPVYRRYPFTAAASEQDAGLIELLQSLADEA